MLTPLKRLQAGVHALEIGLLALLLTTMIVLSVADIVLRNVFDSGLPLAQQIVRVLVLWLGLLGALYATRFNKHITIDVLARYLPNRARTVTSGMTALFSSVICMLIAWHSYLFARDSWSYGDVLFSDIPAWIVQAIIPFSFLLISIRFLAHSAGWLFIPGYSGGHSELPKK